MFKANTSKGEVAFYYEVKDDQITITSDCCEPIIGDINFKVPKSVEGYIYLLQEREFVRLDESTFKIGKTRQEHFKRLKQYPKDSKILTHTISQNVDKDEKALINIFKEKFKHRPDYGREYFEGNYLDMISEINKVVLSENKEVVKVKVPVRDLYKEFIVIILKEWDNLEIYKKKKGYVIGFLYLCDLWSAFIKTDVRKKEFYNKLCERGFCHKKYACLIPTSKSTITCVVLNDRDKLIGMYL